MKIIYANDLNILYYIFTELGYNINNLDINKLIEDRIHVEDIFLSLLVITISCKSEPDFKNRLIKINDTYFMNISIKEMRDLIRNYPENNEFVSDLITDIVPLLPRIFFKDLIDEGFIKDYDNKIKILNPVDKFYRNIRDDILFITDLQKLDRRLNNEHLLNMFHTYELARLYTITIRLIISNEIKDKIIEKIKSPCMILNNKSDKVTLLATLTILEWSEVFDKISRDEIGMENKIICNTYYYLNNYPNIIHTLKCDQRRIIDILFNKYFKIEGVPNNE